MKNFIQKVQELGKKASEIKAAVQSAPGKAAEIRQALTMTAGEFQQLRADVQSNADGLRANTEEHLLQAMREINDRTYTFEEAGYELTGMDLDLTLSRRLAVHLRKFEDVPQSELHSLMEKERIASVKSILAGIIKAAETAANVELVHLKLDGLVAHIGAIPLIRICWSSDTLQEEQQPHATPVTVAAPVTASATAAPMLGSYFEPRPAAASSTVLAPVAEVEAVETIATAPLVEKVSMTISPQPTKPVSSTSPWAKEALDRFKKMPDLSKHRGS